jgi:hypothetical protein
MVQPVHSQGETGQHHHLNECKLLCFVAAVGGRVCIMPKGTKCCSLLLWQPEGAPAPALCCTPAAWTCMHRDTKVQCWKDMWAARVFGALAAHTGHARGAASTPPWHARCNRRGLDQLQEAVCRLSNHTTTKAAGATHTVATFARVTGSCITSCAPLPRHHEPRHDHHTQRAASARPAAGGCAPNILATSWIGQAGGVLRAHAPKHLCTTRHMR